MSDEQSKSESSEKDPEKLSRLLELELIQKRAEWQRKSARYKKLKAVSILFLFAVILAALVGFYFIFSQVSGQRSQQRPTTHLSPIGG